MLPCWPALAILVFCPVICLSDESEKESPASLEEVPEIRLLTDEQMTAFRQLAEAAVRANRNSKERPAQRQAANLQLHQAFLVAGVRQGLPLNSKGTIRDAASAAVMQKLSTELHGFGFGSVRAGSGTNLRAFERWCNDNEPEQFPGCAQTLLQMLQVENTPTRLALVDHLAKDESAQASAALANRAIMDLDGEVRAAAVKVLKERPSKEYLAVLVDGLRYPWPPVADRAAAALGKLKPKNIATLLCELLDKPDPSAAFLLPKSKRPRIAELVRLNHLRHCLLCHAPSTDKGDLVRAAVPTLGKPLTGYGGGSSSDNFIRADTTFLRQHFSLLVRVKDAKPWPELQRFDFVVRLRPATAKEIAKAKEAPLDYPQRRAVLTALRGITGMDGGDSPGRWRELLGVTSSEGRRP